ncbi:MAG: hypothetical protein Q7T62_06455 [Undibacterium sp.]|nr:hypothetical protein [Undibacterium sp.]
MNKVINKASDIGTANKLTSLSAKRQWHVQRLHHNIVPGSYLGVMPNAARFTGIKQRAGRPIRLHFRQSDVDGACGIHTIAMALAVLGIASPRQLQKMTTARSGIAKKLWDLAQDYYFSGMETRQLCEILLALDVGLRVRIKRAGNKGIAEFTQKHLTAGTIVIVAFSYPKSGDSHFVLVVGVEGMQTGDARTGFKTDALLVLDPGVEEIAFCGHNGRLVLHPLKHAGIDYDSCVMAVETVRLTSAIAVYASMARAEEKHS